MSDYRKLIEDLRLTKESWNKEIFPEQPYTITSSSNGPIVIQADNTPLDEIYVYTPYLYAPPKLEESTKINFDNWTVPDTKTLHREYRVEYEMKGLSDSGMFPTFEDFKDAIDDATVEEITPTSDRDIAYRSRTTSKESLLSLIRGYRSYPEFRNEETVEAIYNGFKNNDPMEYPIVIEYEDGRRRIMAGNTRMDIAFQLGINPKVLVIRPTSIQREETVIECDGSMFLVDGGYRGYILEHVDVLDIPTLTELWESELIESEVDITDEQISERIDEELRYLLDEKTYRDLRSNAPDFLNVRDKSKRTPGSRYQFTDENNVIHFKTNSHRIPGVVYDQMVKLVMLDDLIKKYGGTKRPNEIVRMAIEGDIEVHCTDPSWKYWGFQYIGTKDKYAVHAEPRFPKVRNPQLRGSVCKHLDNVLYILPFQVSKIVADLRKQQRL